MNGFLSSKLFKRIASAVVLIPAALLLIYLGGVFVLLLLAALGLVSMYEWHTLSQQTHAPTLHSLFGFVYITVGLVACYYILGFGIEIGVAFLVALWGSDIGAYAFGKLFGGPKMTPNLSPNKTWAGLLGAILFPVVVFPAVFYFLTAGELYDGFTASLCVVLGVVIGLAGQGGDLIVSKLKRAAKAKDTGTLIPGHGGILDRIDSMFLSAFVFLAVVTILV